MKKDIHSKDYRPVVFRDENGGFSFLTRSTVASEKTIKWEDGKEYPLIDTYISSASHPFYTGKEKLVDIEGRVDKFKARQKAAADRKANVANKAAKKIKQDAEKSEVETQKIGEKAK